MSSGNNLYGALAYNQNKVDKNHAKVIFTSKMIDPRDGVFNINTSLRSFEPYLLANKRTEKPVLHISLNPDPKDSLSDEQLSETAQIYMQKMGYGDQPFIVYRHEDTGRTHIHIVSLRVDENGRKINDRFEHLRSMDVCRELELRYGLAAADQKRRQEGLTLKPVNCETGDVKHQIANVIRQTATSWHFQSFKEYKTLLSLYNIAVEEVRGEVKGKEYKGLIYFALNSKGEKTGNPFKSSLFGKSVGMDALEKRIEKSAEIIKNGRMKERSKKVIASAMRTAKNRADFEKSLEKQGISVLFRQNDEGRIYGATFVDHEQKCVFNGSRLGKEFSANAFNEKFSLNNDFGKISEIDRTVENSSTSELKSCQSFNLINPGSDGFFPDSFSGTGDEIAEQDLVRRLKKKKKQRKL